MVAEVLPAFSPAAMYATHIGRGCPGRATGVQRRGAWYDAGGRRAPSGPRWRRTGRTTPQSRSSGGRAGPPRPYGERSSVTGCLRSWRGRPRRGPGARRPRGRRATRRAPSGRGPAPRRRGSASEHPVEVAVVPVEAGVDESALRCMAARRSTPSAWSRAIASTAALRPRMSSRISSRSSRCVSPVTPGSSPLTGRWRRGRTRGRSRQGDPGAGVDRTSAPSCTKRAGGGPRRRSRSIGPYRRARDRLGWGQPSLPMKAINAVFRLQYRITGGLGAWKRTTS